MKTPANTSHEDAATHAANLKAGTATPEMRRLSVAIFSKADRSGGGASLIAERLAELLIEAGHKVDHWVSYHNGSPKRFVRDLYGRNGRIIRGLHWLTGQLGLQELIPWEFRNIEHLLPRYDVAHFHDISSAISPLTIRRVADRLPTVWTFHDCSPFTGGCLYPMECEAFHTRCRRCPQLSQWPLAGGNHGYLKIRCDGTGFLQAVKRHTAQSGLFTPVAPSQWMANEAMKSGMFTEPPRVIPNPIDVRVFRPVDKARMREVLGLPPEKFCVLISAGNLTDPRKGTQYAVEALQKMPDALSVILVGHDPGCRVAQRLMRHSVYSAGYTSDQRLLALFYAAADAYLFPTLADNLPTSILETMATATPTIGFGVGGVPELVEHGVNGWLAMPRSVDGLVEGLRYAMANARTRTEWAENCLTKVCERHQPERFVHAHVGLYRDILSRRAAVAAHESPATSAGEQ